MRAFIADRLSDDVSEIANLNYWAFWADTAEAIMVGLGYRPKISFTKHCANYRWHEQGRELLATVVEVPEIGGTFIELETITEDHDDLPAALSAIRSVLSKLRISDGDLTNELYTDAVAAAKRPSD